MKKQLYKKGLYAAMTLMAAVMFMSFLVVPGHITVYMAGDSTMAIKEIKEYPETGWGMPFSYFFDSTVTVVNKAKNGKSTKSFIAEGLWKSITDNLKAGDWVLIEFGHNDEVPTKGSYINEAGYQANLERFVNETRSKGANPILLTPVARRKFNDAGKIEGTHEVYSAIVRKVAEQQHVPLIDLDRESQVFLQKLGPDISKMLYDHLEVGENPHYPNGNADDTHFNELGARKMAEIVLADIRSLKLDLANRIVVGAFKGNLVPAPQKK